MRTKNRAWGFYGTASRRANSAPYAQTAYAHAHGLLVSGHGLGKREARDFLDSTFGRHLADDMTAGQPTAGALPEWTGRAVRQFQRNVRRRVRKAIVVLRRAG